MPNISSPFASGIAAGQAQNSNPYSGTGGYSNSALWGALGSGSQPWNNNAAWVGSYNPKGRGPTGPNQTLYFDGGTNYLSQGPEGYGWYRPTDPGSQALNEQNYFANQFNQQMPTLQNQMGTQLGQQVNQQMGQWLQATNSNDAARGMGYGGVAQGDQAGVRSNAATQAAQGQAQINQGLINMQNQINSGAISTGINFQQQEAQMQQSIYGQALQNLQADNAMTSSGVGAAMTTAALIAMA